LRSGLLRVDEFLPQDCDIPWGFNPDPHLIPVQFHNRNPDVWTNHDGLQRLPTQYEHPDLPAVTVFSIGPTDIPSSLFSLYALEFRASQATT
jgi:hypothetical protein